MSLTSAAPYVDYLSIAGTETSFAFSFEYISTAHVLLAHTVASTGVTTIYDKNDSEIDSIGASQVNLNAAFTATLSAGDDVRVFRSSLNKDRLEEPRVDFTSGSTVPEASLDSAYLHVLALAHELKHGLVRLNASVHQTDPVKKSELDALEISFTTPTTGQYVRYNGTSWVNVAIAQVITDLSAAITLNDISDVNIASPDNLKPVIYDSGTGKFIQDFLDIRYINVMGPTTNVPDAGTILRGSGGTWAKVTPAIDPTQGYNISGLAEGDKLIYNNSSSKWENKSRYVYDSGWITELTTGGSPVTLAANAIGYETLTAAQAAYFPFEIVIWGRAASMPEDVYRIVSAVAQGSVTNTVGVHVRYETDTRDLYLFLQDLAVYHEASSGSGNSLSWGFIDEIRITIPR